jgi:hypothetical protein
MNGSDPRSGGDGPARLYRDLCRGCGEQRSITRLVQDHSGVDVVPSPSHVPARSVRSTIAGDARAGRRRPTGRAAPAEHARGAGGGRLSGCRLRLSASAVNRSSRSWRKVEVLDFPHSFPRDPRDGMGLADLLTVGGPACERCKIPRQLGVQGGYELSPPSAPSRRATSQQAGIARWSDDMRHSESRNGKHHVPRLSLLLVALSFWPHTASAAFVKIADSSAPFSQFFKLRHHGQVPCGGHEGAPRPGLLTVPSSRSSCGVARAWYEEWSLEFMAW